MRFDDITPGPPFEKPKLCERYCYSTGLIGRDDLYQSEIALWIEALTCEQSAANKPSERFIS